MINKIVFSTDIDIARHVAEQIKNISNNSSKKINIAISGGSTPNVLFNLLATGYATKIEWSKINIFWVDERCVSPDSSESNFGNANKLWLSKVDIPIENIHRIYGENNIDAEVIRYTNEIKKTISTQNEIPCFDIILLGMGDDGHTASIFPPSINLIKSEKIVEATVNPYSNQNRITLTGKIINNASMVWFLVTGKNKKPVVKQIFEKKAGYLNYPAANISNMRNGLYWFFDSYAAPDN